MWQLAEDTLAEADLEALAEWLRGNPQLTQGPLVEQFEAAWADWVGTTGAVMVTSGSTANLALVTALGQLGERRSLRIGAAAVTWPTNVTPGLMLGHSTRLFDVDRRTLGVDTVAVCQAMANDEIDVLFVTHLLGFNALNTELIDTASRHGVTLIEDCCEAHGAKHHDRRVGSLGYGGTFSFYFGHHMSTIEGGMVNTDDPDLADRLRLIRNHGLARSSTHFDEIASRYPKLDRRFLFVEVGMNYRSTEINAFLGLRQLKLIDERIEQRNANLEVFIEEAPDWLWTDYETAGVSSFALPLIAKDQAGFEATARVVAELGLEARPVVAGNLTLQPFVTDHPLVSSGSKDLTVADHVHRFGLYVGNGHHVSPDMVSHLCQALSGAR